MMKGFRVISMLLIVMLLMTSVACAESPITSVVNTLTNNVSKVMDLGGMTKAIKDVGNDMLRKAIVSFTDVSKHWARNYIGKLASVDVIKGYPDGSFKPNGNITVAEFTTLVLKAGKVDFPQTNPWYQGIVNKALAMGIIEEGEFYDYNRPINRGEMARMIVRALDEKPSSGNTIFKDDSAIPSKFKGYVKKANELGIISGYTDNTFKYANFATRAEASTMIVKMLDHDYNEPAIDIPSKPTQQVDSFIEPNIQVTYPTSPEYTRDYYIINVLNYKDYEDQGYQYKTEVVNYPQLNYGEFYGMYGGISKYHFDEWKDGEVLALGGHWNNGRIWRLALYGYASLKDQKTFVPKKGMEIKHKITFKNKEGVSKSYYIDATIPFTNN